ncbi:MAG: DUF3368 domain-containing protein [Gammaproteobacteria bacterium SHHR-1]|uniref:DUF3368 domain-containing protein n=1 Tax=Magnetovirga frankeli TaxID=947516 RepID=UPI0012932206|nr:DUF3368 domain-containing protein [gamma proteobacterium SS-5]
MAGRVLSDASPLIGLARVDGLPWLKDLFGEVWVPQEVWRELLPGRGLPDEPLLLCAHERGILRLCDAAPVEPPGACIDAGLDAGLDEGETACIRHALADGKGSLLLMDERAGRAIAIEQGLQVVGTAAVIGMARQRGLIPSAKAVFARLHASDFRISAAVISTILRRVGEAD